MAFTGSEPGPVARQRFASPENRCYQAFGVVFWVTKQARKATSLKCRKMGWNPAVSDPRKTESDAPKSRPGLPIRLG